ncbi:MAG: hypothetical protein ACUVRZ_09885 [Desulfobacca sp.]|uniref:hypothetical protein n=1 Tax=Desulfobacca sp. TaxID=2067990 RepID=UPI00404B52F1
MVAGARADTLAFLGRNRARGRKAAALIAATPVVPKEVFSQATQPCDIILTTAPRRGREPWLSRFWLQLSGLAQGCPYCSAKIYLEPNLIAGYGFRRRWDRPLLKGVDFQRFISWLDDALLLRVPALTLAQRQRIDRFVRDQLGAPFNLKWVIQSFLLRQLRSLQPRRKMAPTVPAGSNGAMPLSCSTLIAFPYFREGIAFAQSPSLVWPIDFLLSPLTHKVCRLAGSDAKHR